MFDRVRIVSLGLVGLLALVTLSACGEDDAKIVQEDVTRISGEGIPTPLPTPDEVALTATAEAEAAGEGTAAGATPAGGGGGEITLEAWDIGWRTADQEGPQVTLRVAPGAVINLVNTGSGAHNFNSEGLGIDEDMPVGYTGQITIPADAAPGDYEFICDVPGHATAGMVGTITVDPNAGGGAGAPPPPPADGEAGGEQPGGGDPGAVAGPVRLEAWDIGWRTADQPGPPVELHVAPGTVIDLVNTGSAPHNFNSEALGIDEDMPASYSGQITIPPGTAPGTYEFICDVPGHAAAGMVGTIVVQ